MQVVRVPWSSAAFLVYAGGLVVLVAAAWLLQILEGDYGNAAFVAWSLLVLAVLAALAYGFGGAGRPVPAGLFAVSTVLAFTIFVGAVLEWFGWLASEDAPFDGFHISFFLVELALIVAAASALSRFRFPLLVAVLAGGIWYFVTDVISGGGDWSAIVSIAVGLVFLMVAVGANEVYAFWWHLASGLITGGGLLWFWHTSDLDWILVAIAGLVYVWLADRLGRSSWAVLGALGLLLSTTHFVDDWFGFNVFAFLPFGEFGDNEHEWARPISYAVLGLVYVLLGLRLERRRRALETAQPAV